MNQLKNNKSGFSLIELVVAMGIFVVVITLAIGAFVAVSRMKALTSTMKEVQQKTRIASEMITRLSKQADRVIIINNEKTLDLFFNSKDASNRYAYRFNITSSGALTYSECGKAPTLVSTSGIICTEWSTETNLLGDTVIIDSEVSFFRKTPQIPPNLEVYLKGKISDINNNSFYSDEFILDTKIIMESIR